MRSFSPGAVATIAVWKSAAPMRQPYDLIGCSETGTVSAQLSQFVIAL